MEIVAVNDLADTKTLAHLLRHDSNYGTYQHEVGFDEKNLIVENQKVQVLAEKDPAALPWKDLGVDIVIESTGLFTDPAKARAHIEAGAKKVIISAPAKGDGAETIVIGVNEDKLPTAGDIISNASCTTNCIAPVAAIIENNFGIEKATMTTAHSYTASQRLQDAPAKDLREARNAATNLVPTTTGASVAAAKALPALEGIFGGLSIRVPTPVVSLSDFTILTKRDVTAEEVNEAFKKAAADPYYQGILAITEEELVSSDFIGNSHSAIVDLKLTSVVGGNLLKVIAWYDNEWGYCNRLVELAADTAKLLAGTEKTKNEAAPQASRTASAPKEISITHEGSEPLLEHKKSPPLGASAEPEGAKPPAAGGAKPYTIIENTPETETLPEDRPSVEVKTGEPTPDDLKEALAASERLLEPPDSAKEDLLPPPSKPKPSHGHGGHHKKTDKHHGQSHSDKFHHF